MSNTATITKEPLLKNLEADYDSHPAELVRGGKVNSNYTTQDLRNAIPAYCFKPSYFWSFWYLIRDLVVAGTLIYTAYNYIPRIRLPLVRGFAWAAYGYVRGQQMTGIWVIGHECGHGAFSTNHYLNDFIGWLTHSTLMTPYFFFGNPPTEGITSMRTILPKDHNYVPPQMAKYASLMGVDVGHLGEMAEDSPLYTFARIVIQQVFGFPWYLMANITATQGSLANNNPPSKYPLGDSHFLPTSALFRPEEWHLILASDIGIGLAIIGLWYAATRFGLKNIALLYVMPYLWVNHWIVAITYLHHTHPEVPKYEPEAWTFLKGATATIDRELGFGGKHLMHNIAEFHIIHHLFFRIPQYHAEEATKAILPLLGDAYHADKKRSFWGCIWESFTQCQYVVPDDPAAKLENRAMYYKGGPTPRIEISMGRSGLNME